MSSSPRSLLDRIRDKIKDGIRGDGLGGRIGRNFSISITGSGLSMAMGIAQTALLTKKIALADYGRVYIVLNLFGFLVPFLGLRVNDLLYRYYPEFEEEGRWGDLRALLFLALGINVTFAVVLAGGSMLAAPVISRVLYSDPSLTPMLRIYAIAIFLLVFEEVYATLLRLSDRFAAIVVPQVMGRAASLGLLGTYLLTRSDYDLSVVMSCLVVGAAVQTVPPMVMSAEGVVRAFRRGREESVWTVLRRRRRQFGATLFQTNILGYLKLASDSGGMFLLGVLASPVQVAYFNVAQQLTRPLVVLQQNIGAAIAPEVMKLWAQRRFDELYALTRRLTRAIAGGGLIFVLIAFLVARPLLLTISTPDYLPALKVFYVMLLAVYLTFVSLVFFRLALCMDELPKRNLIVGIRLIYLAVASTLGLTAFRLGLVHLLGSATTRVFNDMPLFRKLKRIRDEASAEPEPPTAATR